MGKHFPRPVGRRSVLGLGLGLTALTATPLGSLLGLSAEASATGHGPDVRPTDPGAYISFTSRPGSFPLVRDGRAAPVVVSDRDWAGVVRVAGDLRDDIERVTGIRPALAHGTVPMGREVTIIGTVGRSPLIDGLIAKGRLDVSAIEGKWETSLQTVVDKPLPGVDWSTPGTPVVDRPVLSRSRPAGFVEANGYVSIEADHYGRAVNGGGVGWQRIADIGRTGAGMEPSRSPHPGRLRAVAARGWSTGSASSPPDRSPSTHTTRCRPTG
ncbi:hypothetical protein FHX80_12134 [Streptomyces brevispora]|uniref:Gylcosyl hydrolase 115 C-terminal domain-containing protein n=1 Tax=Streptomyces brevispora TaxID=887462 RepID=A0A561TXL6_9ACTN|nr:hypothetical protein FHX80_12134 [Streptomyces brevispora]